MKKLIFLSCFSFHFNVFAQPIEINGKVLDRQGAPVSSATITIKGTKTAIVAHVDGSFKIDVSGSAILVVSAVGYESQEVNPSGRQNLTIVLKNSNASLSEVVVTALGIKREKKALGYAVSTVGGKELELRPEGDIARVLNGKVPGLDVLNSSGISGSGTRISIRGISSITGFSATPMFVVDGVPFNSDNNLNDNFAYGGGTSTTSRFLDLDPNNIESVSVLKGLSATTLYGETARNGVILITTKNGAGRKTKKKLEVTALQSLFANHVANLPAFQNTYGGGFDLLPSSAFSNWGAAFTDPPLQVPYSNSLISAFPEYGTKTQDYKAYKSVENFFRTGIVSTSSVNVATSGANTTFNANYSYLDDEGFTPNNRVYKNNFGLGGTAKLTDNLNVHAVLNFVITDFKSPILGSNGGGGSADVASVFGDLLYTPRSVDLMGLPYQNPVNGSSIYYRSPVDDIQNPLWTANNALTRDITHRTFGTFGLGYAILKGLSINYRLGLDLYNE
jgi:TonB-dependent SusC/RagA subfamily outer membrane receptor